MFLGKTSNGLFLLFSYISNKKGNKSYETICHRNTFTETKLPSFSIRKTKHYLLFVLNAFILYISSIFHSLFYKVYYPKDKPTLVLLEIDRMRYILSFTEIFAIFPLYNKIFRISLYKHQIFALIINAIGIIYLFLTGICNLYLLLSKIQWHLVSVFVLALVLSFCKGFSYVIDKTLMIHQYYSPYEVLLYQGLCGIAFSIIGIIIAQIIPCHWNLCKDEEGVLECFTLSMKFMFSDQLLSFLASFFLFALASIAIELINWKYTPPHVSILACLSSIFWIIYIDIKNRKKAWMIIIDVLWLLVILITVLIYCEVIILKFLGLNENTADEIRERANYSLDLYEEQSESDVDFSGILKMT